ncbi:MAG: hypothetical protein RRC34_09950 [Lentisphaeria bacterium]|nr:hypothetical protein [Lentisphaeria bacterium]
MNQHSTTSKGVKEEKSLQAGPLMDELRPMIQIPGNQPSVCIHSGRGTVLVDNTAYEGPVNVQLELVPKPCIRLCICLGDIPLKSAIGIGLGQMDVNAFTLDGVDVPGFLTGTGGSCSDGEELILNWCPSSEPVSGIGDETTQVSRLVCHLFNFRQVFGVQRTVETHEKGTCATEHIPLSWKSWRAELRSLHSSSQAFKDIKEKGGVFLTHVLGFEKVKGESFTAKEADAFLLGLRFFLSFAKGSWCNPVCPVGIDCKEQSVWSQFSSPNHSLGSRSSWFDPHTPIQLAQAFPLFMEKWTDLNWQEAFREVIYWYMNANSSSNGIDGGIILAQAALERLAFEFAVKDKRLITAMGFKDLRASDKLRILFSSVGIPLDISTATPETKAYAKKNNWLDAPHALTEIRNSLMHPEHKKKGEFNSLFYEAWKLCLWYLEMSILAICGYSGTYGNRLKQRRVGQVENVPWSEGE